MGSALIGRLRWLTIAAALAAAAVTLLVTFGPLDSLAYRSPPAHAAIEVAAGLTQLLIGYLVLGRYRRSAERGDLVMGVSLLVIAGGTLLFSALPTIFGSHGGRFTEWAPPIARLIGAAGFASAAFLRGGKAESPRRELASALGSAAAVLAVVAVAIGALSGTLPPAVDPSLSPQDAGEPRIVGNGVLLAVQLVTMSLFVAAAYGYGRRALREGDELLGWVSLGSLLLAFARFNYFLFPSVVSEWVFTGDLLRFAGSIVMLAGAAREIGRYQLAMTDRAVTEERRRVARNIHDGLAQELAFLVTQSRWLAQHPGDRKGLEQLVTAAERALDESRDAIAILTRRADEPLDIALTAAAEGIAEREGARVRLKLDSSVRVRPEAREALMRIVREAVRNAATHGDASMIDIQLVNNDGVQLRIADDGRGFDVEHPPASSGGFGLISMRERAKALGGELDIESTVGSGTVVEVRLP